MKKPDLSYLKGTLMGILLFGMGIGEVPAQFVKPDRYFTFDEANSVRSSTGGADLDTAYYRCSLGRRDAKVGRSVFLQTPDCILNTLFFYNKKPTVFAIEFLFKGKGLQYLSFPTQALNLSVSGTEIYFKTTSVKKGNSQVDELTIPLNGKGKQSSFYLMDGEWHHFVFLADLVAFTKEVWLDGELLPGGRKKIAAADEFVFSEMDGLKAFQELDELAFYSQRIPEEEIKQHYAEFTLGRQYTFTAKEVRPLVQQRTAPKGEATEFIQGFDAREFAPGYPRYKLTALDQLRSFPLPRYRSGVTQFRNISWADMQYLHLVYPNGATKGLSDPANAVKITEELARNWNYYIDLPCLRTEGEYSQKRYSSNRTVEGALIEFANQNPSIPVSTIMLQAQNKPEHIGVRHSGPFVSSQQLPDRYYLKNAKGEAVLLNRRKWLSPLMPLDVIKKDGQNSRYYLEQLTRYLRRPLSLINENGEVYGNMRPEEYWKADPEVFRHFQSSKLSNAQYNGLFQYLLDSVYKAEIMSMPGLGQTRFTFYNLSAVQSAYWPDYKIRRTLNSPFGGAYRSTPDFYPAVPDNWTLGRGSLNGYGLIAEGRRAEIAMGDALFSPFVSAGWDVEEKNIRPAQWLALLKAMVMLGADFFYTGYFNVTDNEGKWPNKYGPNDPAGYVYQLAIPAYAQATASYAKDFFTNGSLLNGGEPKIRGMEFRFEGNNSNELILVRKSGAKYLIYGSIQPSSNAAGTVPFETRTTIELEGQKISFMIRRQGIMYIYDRSGAAPLFYAIDGWHQYEHPSYWKEELSFEAELADTVSKGLGWQTQSMGPNAGDYSQTVTSALLRGTKDNSAWLEWKPVLRARSNRYSACDIRIRAPRVASNIRVWVNGIALADYSVPVSGDWTTLALPLSGLRELKENSIRVECLQGEVMIDWLTVK